MRIVERVIVVLIVAVIGIAMGWPLQPSHAGGYPEQASCAKPPRAACGDKTIIVHADGLHGNDKEVFVCHGDKLDWQVDDAEGKVTDFTVHFDESPFDPNFGSRDYCAGKHCSGHQHGTDKLVAHAKVHSLDYVRCHQYKITVALSDGSKLPIDPHVIVGTMGSAQ
jgi:hypothetical protein